MTEIVLPDNLLDSHALIRQLLAIIEHGDKRHDADGAEISEKKMRRRNYRKKAQNSPENLWNANPVDKIIGVILMALRVFRKQKINFSHGFC